MSPPLGWGIVGTGAIASDFVRALRGSKRCFVRGVCGSSPDKSKAFAARHDVAFAAPSYADLLARPEIQAIYVATPNSLHQHNALEAILAGKHVLCEKPLTVDAASTQRVI